ncbi:hypothetical protein NC651_030079 [Populus alba x Populus x berolinensis]|nr:hypothetical protein NC651_030079 [Populus alba x Populus x berolinensis]
MEAFVDGFSRRVGIEKYGFEEGESSVTFAEKMKDKGPVWEEIVRENQLLPNKLEQVGDGGLQI